MNLPPSSALFTFCHVSKQNIKLILKSCQCLSVKLKNLSKTGSFRNVFCCDNKNILKMPRRGSAPAPPAAPVAKAAPPAPAPVAPAPATPAPTPSAPVMAQPEQPSLMKQVQDFSTFVPTLHLM